MNSKLASAIFLMLVLLGTPAVHGIRLVMASATIHVRADGTIDPATAPILRSGSRYVLTGNITCDADGVVVETDNIVLDGAGYRLSGSGRGKGVNLAYRRNVTVERLGVMRFEVGINLYKSADITVSANSLADNEEGVKMRNSFNNTVIDNKVVGSSVSGIAASFADSDVIFGNHVTASGWSCITLISSSNITISENTLDDSHRGIHLLESNSSIVSENRIGQNSIEGIWLDTASRNIIVRNTVEENAYAIRLYQSSNNSIHSNNLLSNALQVYDVSWGCKACNPSLNQWVNSSILSGNFWSDYVERYPNATEGLKPDIWNTPYIIDENNRDECPLISPSGDLEPPLADAGPDVASVLGATVAFNGGKSTDDLAIRSYSWSLTDGESQFLSGMQPSHTFSNIGDFEVVLNVSDYSGNWNTDGVVVRVRIITIQSPRNMTYHTGEVLLDLIGSPSFSWIGYSLDSQANVTVAENATLSELTLGLHNLTVYAHDATGNTWVSDPVYFSVDLKEAAPSLIEAAVIFVMVGVISGFALLYLKKLKKQQAKPAHTATLRRE